MIEDDWKLEMSKGHYRRKVTKLMIENDFILVREKNHLIWEHTVSGERITTAKSPRNEWRSLKNLMGEIRRVYRLYGEELRSANDNYRKGDNDNNPNRKLPHRWNNKSPRGR